MCMCVCAKKRSIFILEVVEKVPIYTQFVAIIYYGEDNVSVLRKWRCPYKCELYVGSLGTAIEHEMFIVCMCRLRERGANLRKGIAGKSCS